MKNYTSIIQNQANFIDIHRNELATRLGLSVEELAELIGSNTKLAIVQIPYIHSDHTIIPDCELVESHFKPMSSFFDLTIKKFQTPMDIKTLEELVASNVYQSKFQRDGFGYASEYIREGLRHKVKLLILDAKINPDELTVLTVKIRNQDNQINTFQVVPLVQFYSLNDVDVTLTDKIATINISRGARELRKVDIFTFKFRIRKDSPNIDAIKKLIEIVETSMKLDMACLSIFKESILN